MCPKCRYGDNRLVSVVLRLIAMRAIAVQLVIDKFLQQALSPHAFRRASSRPEGRVRSIFQPCVISESGSQRQQSMLASSTHLRSRIPGRDQKSLQLRLQPRANDVRRILRLLQQLRRDNHIGIHRPQAEPSISSPQLAAKLRARASDSHRRHQRCLHFFAELQQAVIGKTPQHESNISFRQRRRNIGNPFRKKTIVPQVCIRIKRHGCQKNYHRLA